MEIVNSINAGQSSQTKSDTAGATLARDFDTFLVLLTTQLQYQDPLQPLDSNEFTQQLVSFTGVEQQIQVNKNLETLISMMAAQDMSATVGYIGKDVIAMSDKVHLKDGEAKWVYHLEANADDLKLTIRDNRGLTVRTLNGEAAAGTHDLVWDGRDDNGNELPSGYYTLNISAKTVQGNKIRSDIMVRGMVEGVERIGGENLLSVNGLLMPLENVQGIMMPKQAPAA